MEYEPHAHRMPWWATAPDMIADRWTTVTSGNFVADTAAKRFARRAVRSFMVAVPFGLTKITMLDGTIRGEPVLGILQFLNFILMGWASIAVATRSHDKARQKLLQTALSHCEGDAQSTPLSTFVHGCAWLVLVVLLQLAGIARALMWANDKRVGPVWGFLSLIGFTIVLMGVCDIVKTASRWVNAARREILRWGYTTIVMLSADRKADQASAASGRAPRAKWARQVSVLNSSEGKVSAFDEEPERGESPPEAFTRARFEDAYEAARDVVETMNEILSGPLTAIFCVFVGIEILMVSFSRAKQKEGGEASEIALLQFFAVWIGLLIIFLLKWLASVGDTFAKVVQDLLSPGFFMRLALALDQETSGTNGRGGLSEAARHALLHSRLGFSLYNVTMTTDKLLYLIGTFVFYFIISSASSGSSR